MLYLWYESISAKCYQNKIATKFFRKKGTNDDQLLERKVKERVKGKVLGKVHIKHPKSMKSMKSSLVLRASTEDVGFTTWKCYKLPSTG